MTVTCSDLALSSPEVLADPYPYFDRERSRAAVQWHEELNMWMAFSHSSANAVLRARTLGRIWTPRWPDIPLPAFELIHVNSLLESEPPVHTRLRRLVAGAFARGHIERLRPRVAELASALADRVAEAGADGSAVDLIELYAEPLPVQVIAELLGVPRSDWELLRPWSNAIVKMYEYGVTDRQRVAAETASAEFIDYLQTMVDQRRGALTEDLVSSLIAETDSDGARLTEDELITTCTLLLNAGHEATVNVVGNGVLALGRHPDQWQRLVADPGSIDPAVEELIRYDSPLQLFERTAISDTPIGAVTVAQGQKIAALLGAANRDPEVFADPGRFDVGRSPNPHLGFGAGIHFCVGAPLARLELQTSLRTLLTRFPGLGLAAEPPARTEFVLRGLHALPVTIQ
jgi:cytochrome P450